MQKFYPLTSNQIKLYEHQKLYSKDPSYNLTLLYKIEGELDLFRFKSVLEIVYDAIDIFKVDFVELGEAVYQRYQEGRKYTINLVYKDVSESADSFRQKIIDCFNKLNNIPINLEKWPLFSPMLYKCNEQEHYLIFYIPHIITDGYSHYIFSDVVNTCYNSHFSDEETRNYAENYFGAFLREEGQLPRSSGRENNTLSADLKYLDTLEVNKIKQTRNSNHQIAGRCSEIEIYKKNIYDFVKDNKISESCFFISMCALLLKKTTGEKVIVLGIPVLNRSKSERSVIGYFVNTLPLVIDFSNIKTFSDLVSYINTKMFSLLRDQSFDSSSLGNVNTRMNCLFTYYDREFNFDLKDCKFKKITSHKQNFIMSEFRCTVENLESSYKICLESGEYFKDVKIKNIIKDIIGHVIKNYGCSIKNIPLFRKQSSNSIYKKANLYLKNDNITSIKDEFEKIVKKYPNKAAVYDSSHEWSYARLNEESNKIARHLSNRVKNSDKIIISIKRNNYLIATIMAVLKLGKCYVPIDLSCPQDRFSYIFKDLGSTVVIGEKYIKSQYKVDEENFISIDKLINESALNEGSNLELPVSKDNTAYIIYTSGSTGEPNGVQISNANLLSLLEACKSKFHFNHTDVWTLFHSYGFDFSVWEIFGCILSGGKLIVVDNLTVKSPNRFYDLLVDQGVTVLNQTPTAFKLIIKEDSIKKQKLNLKYVIFGGEALSFPILQPWAKNHPLAKTKLINMYGITETTIHVTFYEVTSQDLGDKRSVIGKPLTNLGIYIANEDGDILPQGLPGEIVVFGDGVSQGYFNKTKLTKSRFYSKDKDPQNYYRSGDLGKIDRNGNIEYLGRLDRQIQLRGFRIELGEIERRIIKSGLVEDCVVSFENYTADKDDHRIIAYIIPKAPFYKEDTLKSTLKEFLPLYMIPSLFVSVSEIPLTINGKVDFKALKGKIKIKNEGIKGKTPTEQYVFQIISKRVGNTSFSTKDNLLDIGLTSIDLAGILSDVKEKWVVKELSILDLFQHPSVEKLARYINNKTIKSLIQPSKYGANQDRQQITSAVHLSADAAIANI